MKPPAFFIPRAVMCLRDARASSRASPVVDLGFYGERFAGDSA